MRSTKVETAAGIRHIRYRQSYRRSKHFSHYQINKIVINPIVSGFIGLILVTFSTLYLTQTFHSSTVQAHSVPVEKAEVTIYSRPTQIEFPSLATRISIQSSSVINNQWQVSDHIANHLLNSSSPGEKGNIIIYGHNKKDIFGKLKELTEGDQIILHTEDGSLYTYRIVEQRVVSPTEVSILQQTETETLTIYTCIGLLDSQRLIIRAIPLYS